MGKKRKPPVAKSLIQNSISAYFSAIEIHNKPKFQYRYEIVIILIINSWELALKAYIYKNHKQIKIFLKDGTSKPFLECLSFMSSEKGKEFSPIKENLKILYDYRNQIIHFHHLKLEVLIYSIIAKNVTFYNQFLKKYLKTSLLDRNELVLLPIGFKKPFSPIDFLSNESVNANSPKLVQNFILKIIKASEGLLEQEIDESILSEFKLSLINSKRIKNSDIVASVNNSTKQSLNFNVQKKSSLLRAGNEENATAVQIIRDKSENGTILVHEQLSDGIFEEINNVVDINEKLRKSKKEFLLGEALFYRIYSERIHVSFNKEIFEIYSNTGLSKYYAPFYYWITQLETNEIASIIINATKTIKSPFINSIIKLVVLLVNEGINLFRIKLEEKFKHVLQKPDYYYTLNKIKNRQDISNLKLRALRFKGQKQFHLPVTNKDVTIEYLLRNKLECSNELSKICLEVFQGNKELKSVARLLDFISYSDIIIESSTEIINAINELDSK